MISTGSASSAGAGKLGFFDYTAHAYRMVVDGSGNVGIGISNPSHLLHVYGTIGAQEVIVSNTGADYVFQPGYQLRSLAEIGEYINQYRHLQDMPSAKEVQEKGVGLGEMQQKLLAKVEELTLHMIRAEEQANRLEAENRRLRERLVRLETLKVAAEGAKSTDPKKLAVALQPEQ